jgi:hypothetical protein
MTLAKIISTNQNHPNLPSLPESILQNINALTTALNIPRDSLASDEEIQYAWQDLPRELKSIPEHLRNELIARMCVAVSTGLFDGAINYIWNATILHLRDRVRGFGLPVVGQILSRDFEEKHLIELQDSQLLDLCLKLDLINEDGFFFLDQCRSTRNNFSAAHPTLGKINDKEFTGFLNRCVKYALSNTNFPKGVDISTFISAINGARFNADQLKIWVERILNTHDAQRQMVITMAHGVYCDPSTPEPSRLNSLDICQHVKDKFSSSLRSDLIVKHSDYQAKGDTPRYTASQQFFERLGLIKLLNESERHSIFYKAIENLLTAHKGMNNFYNEPPFSQRLLELSRQEKVPETVQHMFVSSVITCYIGNGYGYSWASASHCEEIIKSFSPREISIMVLMSKDDSSLIQKLKHSTECQKRYLQAIQLIDYISIPSNAKSTYDDLIKKL